MEMIRHTYFACPRDLSILIKITIENESQLSNNCSYHDPVIVEGNIVVNGSLFVSHIKSLLVIYSGHMYIIFHLRYTCKYNENREG